jgi:hypothetical protein
MKIEDLLLLQQAGVRPKTRAPGPGEKFSQCLDEAAAHRETQPGQAAGGLPGVVQLSPAGEILPPAAELADAALSRLEIFQTSLARPEIVLKKMAPLVQKLAEDSQRLHEAAQRLPEGSPLRQILEETAALALVESSKFNRGDYV